MSAVLITFLLVKILYFNRALRYRYSKISLELNERMSPSVYSTC